MLHQPSDHMLASQENILSTAQALGFNKTDLIETHQAIAVRAAKLFAKASSPMDQKNLPEFVQHAISLLTFNGQDVPEEIEDAIVAIADLPHHVDPNEIKNIASLIDLHGRFTMSHPDGYSKSLWATELSDISCEMIAGIDLIMRNQVLPGDDLLRGACLRLSRIFGHLWS